MINWYSTGLGALWVFGLSLVTATLSFANFLAGQQKLRFRRVIEKPACRIMIGLGLVFFCLGWAGGRSALWERLVWIVLGLIFALQTWLSTKKSKV